MALFRFEEEKQLFRVELNKEQNNESYKSYEYLHQFEEYYKSLYMGDLDFSVSELIIEFICNLIDNYDYENDIFNIDTNDQLFLKIFGNPMSISFSIKDSTASIIIKYHRDNENRIVGLPEFYEKINCKKIADKLFDCGISFYKDIHEMFNIGDSLIISFDASQIISKRKSNEFENKSKKLTL